ncbi:MAG: C1 family peptidase [Thermomicrobiales bacterium]
MSADLRHLQSTIKDQGRRGTCVACAATAGHELLRAEGIDLCIEFLHWAAKQCDGLPTSSEGTTLLAAAEALAQVGQPPETNWPYDDQRNQWAPDYQPPADACSDATPRRLAGSNELLPTPDALRDALDQGQAPLLGIRLHQTWYEVGSDGYIAIPATGTLDFGGHAILVVGYQNDALIIRNSWGADWGDRGYGYLPASYVSAYGVSAWVFSL